ncbi:hypothetical protein [Caulobacter segnis]|uniref:hypothetical protein n=1 Tax=Caulobacter segnis TaxID=88688 RepID=UPI001CC07B63|nr:hypothetical protein [Caulobacter segnis]UAL12547.1 hypothetical protein K8940_09835 [Caulobacter segnis]
MGCIMGKKTQHQKRAKAKGPAGEARADASLLTDAGGYDWGWPRTEMAAANLELIRRLSAGGFSGCAYGLMSPDGPPFLSLVGTNLAGMKSAMALIREWSDAVGPNALQLEILLDDPGYAIALSQQPDLLRLRLTGLDTVLQPMLMTTSVMKTLDTRHPFLQQLAQYANEPIAPIVLTVAQQPPSRPGAPISTIGFRPDHANAIMLPGLNIYARAEDRPAFSAVRGRHEPPPELTKRFPDSDHSPQALARQRERRLKAALPKTLHVLRHRQDGKALLDRAKAAGCTPWQAEQAVCNLRVPDFLAYQPNGKAKRLAMLDKIRSVIVEPASTSFKPETIELEAVLEQAKLDAAFLVRRLDKDAKVSGNLADLNAQLRELGHG